MQRFTSKNIIVNLILILVYILWNIILGDFRQDHAVMIIIWLTGYYFHEKSRKFVLAFSIFIIFWIVYDSMRIIPNYEISPIHIREPYELEKCLFGIQSEGQLLTPNEYFNLHHYKVLDLLAGFFYINWMPIPLAFGVYLLLKDPANYLRFSLAFLVVNLVGFVMYYLYPAAPPWYVDLYGFDLHIGVPGNRAGLARFDELIHFPLFENIYNKNANVLAAMPSLHSTYPLIVLYFGLKMKLKKINGFFFIFMLGIWFTAVYSGHHYIIDVLAGVIMTILVLLIFENVMKNNEIKHALNLFVQHITFNRLTKSN